MSLAEETLILLVVSCFGSEAQLTSLRRITDGILGEGVTSARVGVTLLLFAVVGGTWAGRPTLVARPRRKSQVEELQMMLSLVM